MRPLTAPAQGSTTLELLPFRALRYTAPDADLAALTSSPYDVVDAGGVAALEATSDDNVVHLILPRDDSGSGEDCYACAARTLERWRADGVMRPDPVPALYVYEQAGPDHVQRGLVGALTLTAPEQGVVLPHEDVMAGPVADRLALYDAVEADLEPIFLLYDGQGGAAARLVETVGRGAEPRPGWARSRSGYPRGEGGAAVDHRDARPLVDAVLSDGLRHRVWAVTDPAALREVALDLAPRRAVIADGHHRHAAYLRRQQLRHEFGRGPGPWDTGLAMLVDAADGAQGPQVSPIHRVVSGRDAAELAGRAAGTFHVHDLDGNDLGTAVAALSQAGAAGHAFLLISGDGGTVRLLTDPGEQALRSALPAARSAAWRALDVAVLHGLLVEQVWQLDAELAVRFEHDVDAALLAAARTSGTAILLNATPASAVRAVAEAGDRMPPKSTLFTPKPRSGLLLRDHRDA